MKKRMISLKKKHLFRETAGPGPSPCTRPPAQLRRLADAADKYHAGLRISLSQRLVVTGLREEDLDAVRADLGMPAEAAGGRRVHGACVCPGTTSCRRSKQGAVSLGLKLDEKYGGTPLPAKVKISVSGCPFSCAESLIRDIGFVGDAKGFRLYAGGISGAEPRAGDLIAEGLSEEDALCAAGKIIDFLQKTNSKKRLGKIIDDIGAEAFKKETGIV